MFTGQGLVNFKMGTIKANLDDAQVPFGGNTAMGLRFGNKAEQAKKKNQRAEFHGRRINNRDRRKEEGERCSYYTPTQADILNWTIGLLNIKKNFRNLSPTFLLPPSSFLLPPSSFLLPPVSCLLSLASFPLSLIS
jgi:hypothetical protein